MLFITFNSKLYILLFTFDPLNGFFPLAKAQKPPRELQKILKQYRKKSFKVEIDIYIKGKDELKLMKLNTLWWIGLIAAICGILMFKGIIQIAGFPSFWMEVLAAGFFAAAALFK